VIELKRRNKPISFDDLLKELQGEKTSEESPGQIPLETLFNEAFMSEYSSFKSFEEFMAKGSFEAKTHEDIKNIPEELLERHVARETRFKDWESMLEKATAEYTAKQ
jgi:hypothetical protein